MDYIETGYSNHTLTNTEINNRMNLIKIGCVLQIIIFFLLMVMNIIFTIFLTILDSSSFDNFYITYSIVALVLQILTIAMSIGSIVLFVIGFFKLSETFIEVINNNMRLSAILLITYIALSQLILVSINLFLNIYPFGETAGLVYYCITNTLSSILIIAAFIFMDQTVQKAHSFGMQKKRSIYSNYFVLAIGIVYIIFYFIYIIRDLEPYTTTIIYSLFSTAVIIGFIEYIIFLGSFYSTFQPTIESVKPEDAMIYQNE